MRFLGIVAAFFLLAVPAQAEWWEAETAHFIIKSRDSQEDTRDFAQRLERFDSVLRQLQGMPLDHEEDSRANKLTVYRFGEPRDMAKIAGAPGSGIAGFFQPRAGQSVAFVPARGERKSRVKTALAMRQDPRTELSPERVLFHEYVHYFMMQHFPAAYPRWYVEGFAELLGTTRLNEDGSAHIGDPPQYRAYQVFQLNDFPLDEMLDSDHQLSGTDGLQHYATGWLLTHYLSFNPQRLVQLREYLVALAQGEDSLEAGRRIFGDIDELEKELRRYKRGPFPGLLLERENYSEPRVTMRELTAAEEDIIMAEMRVRRGLPSDREARDVASDLRSALRDNPGNTAALALLAQAELSADNYDAAEEVATRLLAIDENAIEGWLVRALVASERAKEDVAKAAEARQFASRAADIDRADPRPLIVYYYSFVESGEAIPEMAVIALEQAYDSSGSDPGYRLLLARQLLVEDRLDSARAVLMPIAFRGHKTRERDSDDPSLPKLVKLLAESDRDAAVAMIDEMLLDEDEEDGEEA